MGDQVRSQLSSRLVGVEDVFVKEDSWVLVYWIPSINIVCVSTGPRHSLSAFRVHLSLADFCSTSCLPSTVFRSGRTMDPGTSVCYLRCLVLAKDPGFGRTPWYSNLGSFQRFVSLALKDLRMNPSLISWNLFVVCVTGRCYICGIECPGIRLDSKDVIWRRWHRM